MCSERKKIVLIGDGAVGKTSLLMTYAGQPWDPSKYIPTVVDNYLVEVPVGEDRMALSIWDTAGQEDWDKVRVLSYKDASCFLLCFSVADSVSFSNIKAKWLPELRSFSPEAAVVLVGTKSDLRGDYKAPGSSNTRTEVPEARCTKLAEQEHFSRYVECSALHNRGVQEVFRAAIQGILKKEHHTSAPSVPSGGGGEACLNCVLV